LSPSQPQLQVGLYGIDENNSYNLYNDLYIKKEQKEQKQGRIDAFCLLS
jgi:hypothetical protein